MIWLILIGCFIVWCLVLSSVCSRLFDWNLRRCMRNYELKGI